MTESLREVAPDLWVSDALSAEVLGPDFDLVVDCTGRGPHKNAPWCLSQRPSGSTSHTWDADQLDFLVGEVARSLEAGGSVLIHCNRGVSRSTCLAAAVLLERGMSRDVYRALLQTKFPGSRINTQTQGSLKRWWDAKKISGQLEIGVPR
jgi:hypothetical protein